MASILTACNVSKSFGTKNLFHDISFSLTDQTRCGLIGPNGSGKTTLLKILNREEVPDEGQVIYKKGLRIGYSSQSPHFSDETIDQVICKANPHDTVHAQILLGKAQFENRHVKCSTLSGGWKKRLDIIAALLQKPDLLILDEPTNHLDLEGIFWLEQILQKEKIAYLIVSHDRQFLHTVCTSIIELNHCYPKGLFSISGNMEEFLKQKQLFLEGQLRTQAALSSTVRSEAEYLARAPKARTTKAKGRVDKAQDNLDQLAFLKKCNSTKTSDISFTASERETRKLIAMKNCGISFEKRQLFSSLDLILSPKTRLGLVGKNGSGKTTLLKLLAKTLTPDTGTIKFAENLSIVHFDQHRQKLPDNLSLKDALCPKGEFVEYMGKQIHVHGWARRFLFDTNRLSLPLSYLSGGEKARILLANLMLTPADILLLDEPTNDLDIDTLEILEKNLSQFPGAVVVISHDRFFLSRLCNAILYLDEEGSHHFFADYNQCEAFRKNEKKTPEKKQLVESAVKQKTKLSYNDTRLLSELEHNISSLEKEIEMLEKHLEQSSQEFESTEKIYRSLAETQKKLDTCYEKWFSLQNGKYP